VKLPVKVGDRLMAGDLVAVIDDQSYRLTEKEARAQLAQARANAGNADSSYQRTRELYTTEAASLSDLENAKANAASARANLAVAREGLNAAQLNLSYTELHNVSDRCQVESLPVSVNQNISAGQLVVSIACGEQLRIRSTVPESLITAVELGMEVQARLSTNNQSLTAKIVEVAVSTGDSSGYAIEAELENPSDAVRVGMAGSLTIELSAEENRIVIPANAVLSDAEGAFVYMAEESADGNYSIARRSVTPGELSNEGLEVLNGLEAGERVVVAGMTKVAPGLKVTLYRGVN
ncbi:MAG: efflux RND transporter periplasmic adaptor subunit, partial [Granulosicoccaceae bacterium]